MYLTKFVGCYLISRLHRSLARKKTVFTSFVFFCSLSYFLRRKSCSSFCITRYLRNACFCFAKLKCNEIFESRKSVLLATCADTSMSLFLHKMECQKIPKKFTISKQTKLAWCCKSWKLYKIALFPTYRVYFEFRSL